MLEFALPFRVRAKGVAELRLALGLDGEHLAGVIENRSRRVFLRARPLRIRQRTERRRFFTDADVTRHEISLLERDVEPRVVREFESERLLHLAGGRGDPSQLEKTPDAMFEMNDEVALVQLAEVDLGAVAAELLGALETAAAMRRVASELFMVRQHAKFSVFQNQPSSQLCFVAMAAADRFPQASRKRIRLS